MYIHNIYVKWTIFFLLIASELKTSVFSLVSDYKNDER